MQENFLGYAGKAGMPVDDEDRARVAAASQVRRALSPQGGWQPMIERLVRLVTFAAEAPVGFASLVTSGQHMVLAGEGLDGVRPGDDLPLPALMCQELAATGVPLIVEDTAADGRFLWCDSDRVAACAAFPVRDRVGEVVAVLGAAAPWPVVWSPRQLTAIDTGAQMLADWLLGATSVVSRLRA
ncbi:GAF domain-containing protein [Actinoplanes sp. NPDC051851]|uniref:GAF domain-containing protein n=1 Tax=Actinoplanes sp. NPDC051851 TaxID=3154753 RepID=UPI00342C6249